MNEKPSEIKTYHPEDLRKVGAGMTPEQREDFLRESIATAGHSMFAAFHVLGCNAYVSGEIHMGDPVAEKYRIIFVKNLENIPIK